MRVVVADDLPPLLSSVPMRGEELLYVDGKPPSRIGRHVPRRQHHVHSHLPVPELPDQDPATLLGMRAPSMGEDAVAKGGGEEDGHGFKISGLGVLRS